MAISIDVDKAGLRKVQENMRELRANLANMDEPMAKISIMLDRWVQRNFKTQGGKVGGWKPLKAGGRWVKRRGKGRYFDTSAKILQDTGRLRASMFPFATANKAGIGSSLSYAKNHEEGIGVPVRRMLPESKDVLQKAQQLIEHHILEGTK